MVHVCCAVFSGLRVFPLVCVLQALGSRVESVVPLGAVWLVRLLVVSLLLVCIPRLPDQFSFLAVSSD